MVSVANLPFRSLESSNLLSSPIIYLRNSSQTSSNGDSWYTGFEFPHHNTNTTGSGLKAIDLCMGYLIC